MPDERPEQPGTDSATVSDAQLLCRTGRGDQAAFAELYDRFAPRVLGLVRRLLNDHAQTEEVAREVFLEVWQSAGHFDPSKAGGATWILTIAHRRSIDRIRSARASRNRDTRVAIRDLDPGQWGAQVAIRDLDPGNWEVTENAEVRVERERVKAAMNRLSEAQRQAVSLAYYGGLTHSEIAAQVNAPIGTVKTRLRDGMNRLRDDPGETP